MNKTVYTIAVLFIIAIVSAITYYYIVEERNKIVIKIFHAGSLTKALEDIEKTYEEENPNVDIRLEPSGSVLAIRKVVELGKKCDILFSADYRLIEKYMIPKEYADWVIVFASNELVLAYTDKSKYADEINENNWYEILLRDDVKYGFSHPNLDPAGYRALSLLYMASIYYNDTRIWEELVLRYIRNVEVVINNSVHHILFPIKPDYVSGEKLVIREKSVELVALLDAGVIDYAFEYRSVAVEHGLKYIELPREISLGEDPFINVTITLYYGDPVKEKTVEIKSIKYGLTIPTTVQHYDEAVKLLEWILYGNGRPILEKHGFKIIEYEYIGDAPNELKR